MQRILLYFYIFSIDGAQNDSITSSKTKFYLILLHHMEDNF